NKEMFLTMDNGIQVVVKVPNHNPGKSDCTTSSEVAIMDFLRSNVSYCRSSVI
ncbi:hypothetical protein BJ875DRAFT_371461, partial [Amylocarpus encephaloides]